MEIKGLVVAESGGGRGFSGTQPRVVSREEVTLVGRGTYEERVFLRQLLRENSRAVVIQGYFGISVEKCRRFGGGGVAGLPRGALAQSSESRAPSNDRNVGRDAIKNRGLDTKRDGGEQLRDNKTHYLARG